MTLRRWTSLILAVSLLLIGSLSQAQSGKSVKRGVATVLFSTLGGAILGLSTLSFYGDPEEHTGNITTGALLGAIAGAGYIAYDSSRPIEKTYDYSQALDSDFKNRKTFASVAKVPVLVSYQFEF